MQKPVILISILVIILVTAVLLMFRIPKSPLISNDQKQRLEEATSSVLPTREPNLYKNMIYNFEFKYPFNLNFKESSPEAIIVGNINDLQTDTMAEVHIVMQPLKNPKLKTPLPAEFIENEVRKLCVASGPNIEISCTKVEQKEIITTSQGLKATTFYLTEETIDTESSEVKASVLKGPFFSFDLTRNTPGSQSAIVIFPPLQKDHQLIDPQLIRDIADSLKINILETPTPSPSSPPKIIRR